MFWDFYECLDTVPVWNLRFGDVQTVQDIFNNFNVFNVNVHVLLQFQQECDFYNKNLKSFTRVEFIHNSNMIFTNYYTFTLFTLLFTLSVLFYARRMGR